MSVTVRAPAKVNLHLGVGPVRPDGYHPLATVYHAIGLYDDVTVTEDEDWTVSIIAGGTPQVRLDGVPTDGDNIAIRAGRALTAFHGVSRAAAIGIHKRIPVAGGLAGGSADAAAALVALDRLWDLGTRDEDLLELAAGLGSDVPFGLIGGTAVGEGRGERVRSVADAGQWWWVVVGSSRGMSTPEVYRAFDEQYAADVPDPVIPEDLLAALSGGDPESLAGQLANDLQGPGLGLRPDLRQRFADGHEAGALGCLLSGSGPTVVMLARDADHAREIAGSLGERGHEQVWVAPGPVAGAHVVTYA